MPLQVLPRIFVAFISRSFLYYHSAALSLSFTGDSVLFARRAFISILLLFVFYTYLKVIYLIPSSPFSYFIKIIQLFSEPHRNYCLIRFPLAGPLFYLVFIFYKFAWIIPVLPRPDYMPEFPRPSRSLDPPGPLTLRNFVILRKRESVTPTVPWGMAPNTGSLYFS